MQHIHVILSCVKPEADDPACVVVKHAAEKEVRLCFGNFTGRISTFEVVLNEEQVKQLRAQLPEPTPCLN